MKTLAIIALATLFSACATVNPATGQKECQEGCQLGRVALVGVAIIATAGVVAVVVADANRPRPETTTCMQGPEMTTCQTN
jgi:hypothetical protein